jgi:hypothetical protein
MTSLSDSAADVGSAVTCWRDRWHYPPRIWQSSLDVWMQPGRPGLSQQGDGRDDVLV